MEAKIGRKALAIDLERVGSALDEIKCPECGSTNVNGCHIPFFSFERESEDSIAFSLSDSGIYLCCEECGYEIETQVGNNEKLSENKKITQMASSIIMALHGVLTKVQRDENGDVLTIRFIPVDSTVASKLHISDVAGSC